MCPNLKQVVFNAADNWGKHPYLLDFYNGSSQNDPVMTDDSDDASEDRSSLMVALLNRWPKVRKPYYVQPPCFLNKIYLIMSLLLCLA